MKLATFTGSCVPIAVTLCLVTLGLSGCQPADGPVAISELDGELYIAVCDDLVVGGAYGSFRPEGGQWARFWEADGQSAIADGTVAPLGQDSFGLRSTLLSAPTIEPGSQLAITFLGEPNPSSGTVAQFSVPTTGLAEGEWLTPRGDVLSSPCE